MAAVCYPSLLVQSGEFMKTPSALPVRASISFPPNVYRALKDIARVKKVSLAWVVRDAAEEYVADETADGGRPQRQVVHASRTVTQKAT